MMTIATHVSTAEPSKKTPRYAYTQAIEDLQDGGCLSLENVQKLSYADLNNLCEEIKRWRVYGNQDPSKLSAVPNASI